jgi:SAM-dependent methyltransferase
MLFERALRSIRKRGVFGTIIFTFAVAKSFLLRKRVPYRVDNPWYRYLDKRFDKNFAVDISVTPEAQLLVSSDPRFKHSEAYFAIPRSVFFRGMRSIGEDLSKFVFIDFGCGKGKALLLASELPFKEIVGVELSSQLIQIAESNLKSYTKKTGARAPMRLECIDAREYNLPDEPCVCYLFNPFHREVLITLLENIHRSLAKVRRTIYIVYVNPVYRDLLDQSGFLELVRQSYLYAIYKS